MLELPDVDRIVARAAEATLKGATFSRALSGHATDSQGRDALDVTIILNPISGREIPGASALDLIVRIQQDLLKAGDERFAIVNWATEDDLKDEFEQGDGTQP